MPPIVPIVSVPLALMLRFGQTLLLGGTVRSKNVAGVTVRAVLDLAVLTLTLWAVGGVFMPEPTRRIMPPWPWSIDQWIAFGQVLGNPTEASHLPAMALTLLAAATVMTAAVIGATAERIRLAPTLVFSAIAGGIALPFARNVAGYQRPLAGTNFDFALATIGGGAAAIVLARQLGARKGKFNRDLSANFVPGHAVIFQFVGLLVVVGGSVAFGLDDVISPLLGGCAAMLAGAAFGRLKFGKIDAGLLVTATIGGLSAGVLSASPALGEYRTWIGTAGGPAVVAGTVTGVFTPWLLLRLETIRRIDDVAGFGPAYLAGGTIGLLVHALIRRTDSAGDYFALLAAIGVLWIAAVLLFGGLAWAVATVFHNCGGLRLSETAEYDGSDLSELDVNAYPDFQQTMIKSHHLRQL